MNDRTVERRLAAILAADVAGFSRLMGADEEGALRTLTGHREILDVTIARHHGRIFNTAGDSVVAEFASPVDAVRCAVEAQQALTVRNTSLPEAQRMQFRMGLHLGDVMVKGSDLLGDGVNVAARLEGLAEPGGICLSRAVYEQVRAALPLDYQYLGEKALKNIARPVPVYRLGGPGLAQVPTGRRNWLIGAAAALLLVSGLGTGLYMWRASVEPPPTAETATAALSDKPSIAVLPFDNLSGNSEETYFSDGMTEDLITDLSKVSGLLVIARNSSFAYRGKAVNIAQVGRDLGCRYVVEGSVRRAGERIRITAQLIDTATNAHVWADRYDREMKDIFDLQDDVRQKIVAALAVKLAPEESERLARKPTHNVEAYDLLVRGLALESRFTPEDNAEARRAYLRAIELDPKFARALGKVANTYAIEVNAGWIPSSQAGEAVATSIRYGEQAVALDDSLPEAHWTLAFAYAYDRQVPRALEQIDRAIAINPNYADALAYRAILLGYEGRSADGAASVERAMRVNPQYPHWYLTALGLNQYALGRYEAAVATLKRGLDRNPNWQPTRRYLIAAYGQLGRVDDAQWEIAEMQAAGSAITLSDYRATTPYRDPAALERVLEGLRKAGVPE